MSEQVETESLVTKTIKEKIRAFFIEQSFNRRIDFSILQIFIDVKNETELNFNLYSDKKIVGSPSLQLIGEVSLEKDILKLTMLEKFATSEEKVMAKLYSAINNFATELQVKKEVLQILIRSSNEYFICIDKHIDHKITINQIIS
jgi:hypothetical protein